MPRELILENEATLEATVSTVIGAMPFIWLEIDDPPGPESLRGYVERNAIALLSNYGESALDSPSTAWLGGRCDREKVIRSGLWNNRHVEENYAPEFLTVFEGLA